MDSFEKEATLMGNEYHTTADCLCKVMFHIEICEGKDQPKGEVLF